VKPLPIEAMINLIEGHRAKLDELCRRCHVRTLEIFGSAADGTFDPEKSDLDFLVEFLSLHPAEHADAYFGLLFGLEDLFCRKIDLLEAAAIRNPYLLKSVNKQRTVLYAA
jgi:predicted nucleotidyltransferase